MKVTIRFEETSSGRHSQSIEYAHTEVESIQDLVFVFKDAANAAGFSFVEEVGVKLSNGEQVWTTLTPV